MMRMQTEGESPMELNALLPQQHVACGGAARTLDVKKLTEAWKRGRVETEAESEIDGELRAASTMGRFEAAREDPEVDARRRAMRRRVIASLALAAVATAALCWEYLPALLAWLADAQAVRAFVADHAIASCLAMLGINIVQVLLAFLPGEPVELASGYAFGFWGGDGPVPGRLGAGDLGHLLGDAPLGLEARRPVLRPLALRPLLLAEERQAP